MCPKKLIKISSLSNQQEVRVFIFSPFPPSEPLQG